MAKQGHLKESDTVLQESLDCAYRIDFETDRISKLSIISTEMAQQGQLESAVSLIHEVIASVNNISDHGEKEAANYIISHQAAKQGLIKESLTCLDGITEDMFTKRVMSSVLCQELAKYGKIEEAIENARGIIHEDSKSKALKYIAVEIAMNGNFHEAENIGLEIPRIAERHDCWREIAIINLEEKCWKSALNVVTAFKNHEAQQYYLRGWCEKVKVNVTTADCIFEALPFIVNDVEGIESLLQKYALQETLLVRRKPELIERLNNTLNIQWAIDIAAQFPKDNSAQRLSKNLEEWINEIADEDDRDQIELWAKQVVKGKITEEQFGQLVSEI
jgi:hypothetical protein